MQTIMLLVFLPLKWKYNPRARSLISEFIILKMFYK